MKLSFYTIDDLRLGYDPQGEQGWRQSRFLDWRDALEQYRSLPDSSVKVFGLSNGEQDVELVRRLSTTTGSTTWDMLVPVPGNRNTSKQRLKGKRLWPDVPGIPESAVRWLYLSGAGWISPTELKRRYPAPEQSFCYPVISKYRVDGIRKGHFVPLELTYWEYKMLVRRTQEWLDHKKM